MRTYFAPLCIAMVLAGCVVTPALDYDGAGVSDVVQRVRCELAFAVPSPRGPFPTGKYHWLNDWTAKVDLSLQTVETSGVTANVSFIEPLGKSETFTFGAGGGATTTADRTARLSFTVAFRELVHLKGSPLCELPFRLGLLGKLGLKEWLESALVPVEEGRLFVGYHESGKSEKKGSDSASPSPRRSDAQKKVSAHYRQRVTDTDLMLKPVRDDIAMGLKRVAEGEVLLLAAQKYGNETAAHAIGYKNITRGKTAPELQSKDAEAAMQATYNKAQKTLQTVELGSAALEVAKILAWAAKKDLPGISRYWHETKLTLEGVSTPKEVELMEEADWNKIAENDRPDQAMKDKIKALKKELDSLYPVEERGGGNKPPTPIKEIETRAKDAGEFASSAVKLANDALADLPQSPPLDSIAQSLKFTIVANANVSPNWTLVRFRGPAPGSNPLFNASRTRQHTLEVVLGPPGTPGGKDLSDEQRRQLFNLRLDSAKVLVVPF